MSGQTLRRCGLAAVAGLMLATCANDSGPGEAEPGDCQPNANENIHGDGIPLSTEPCWSYQEYWPFSLSSHTYPITVHYSKRCYEPQALEVVRLLDISWRVEVEELGFTAPPTDEGTCGPDSNYDVFVWKGHDTTYVLGYQPNLNTPWQDYYSYMVVDPWGTYGGELLDVTVAHELNHACQLADDVWENIPVLEMTATYVEDLVFDDDDSYMDILADFQAHPDWTLDFDDGWETWYMYSAALYLHFLNERYFPQDLTAVAEIWYRCRSEQQTNEPDFEDAVESLLQEHHGIGFHESLVEFARWRWFVASRDDGNHFSEGHLFPEDSLLKASQRPAEPGHYDLTPAPMLLGNVYTLLKGEPHQTVRVSLIPEKTRDLEWTLQALGPPAAGDGEVIPWSVGGQIQLDANGERPLVVTLTPNPADDPDQRGIDTYTVGLVIE